MAKSKLKKSTVKDLEKVRNGEKLGKAQQSYLVNLLKPMFTPSAEVFFGTQAGNIDFESLAP